MTLKLVLLFITFLFSLFKGTLQNSARTLFNLEEVENLIQQLNYQEPTTTKTGHQKKLRETSDDTLNQHGKNNPNLFNIQNLNFIFKHNDLAKSGLRSDQNNEPLEQLVEDRMCKITGKCGCEGNSCYDIQQTDARRDDKQDLTSILDAIGLFPSYQKAGDFVQSLFDMATDPKYAIVAGKNNHHIITGRSSSSQMEDAQERCHRCGGPRHGRNDDSQNDRTDGNQEDKIIEIKLEQLAVNDNQDEEGGEGNFDKQQRCGGHKCGGHNIERTDEDRLCRGKRCSRTRINSDDPQNLNQYSTTYNINDNLDAVVVELPDMNVLPDTNKNTHPNVNNPDKYDSAEELKAYHNQQFNTEGSGDPTKHEVTKILDYLKLLRASKSVLPLTNKQKKRLKDLFFNTKPQPKLYAPSWRRSITQELGIPFELQLQGLGQLNT